MLVAAQLVDVSHIAGKDVFLAGLPLLVALVGWVLRARFGREVYRDAKPGKVSVSEVLHPVFTIVAALLFGSVLWHAIDDGQR